MNNLIKNAIRSFKTNKLSIIGLIFLLFFGLGAFCTMSNTTANIKNEYSSISSEGKLHDFTAAELYEVGSAGYLPNTKGISYDVSETKTISNYKAYDINEFIAIEGLSTNTLYNGTELGEEEGTYYLPIPTQEHHISESGLHTYTRTYHITLDPKLSTGLYQFFAESKQKTKYTSFDFKVTSAYEDEESVPQSIKDLSALLDGWGESKPSQTLIENSAKSNIFSLDYEAFIKFINEKTQNIYSIMTVTDTPLAMHIEEKYADEVDYRFFKSLNVTATKDNIFYKIIDSNAEDTIDTIVSFSDSDGRSGNTLYSTNDWAPYNSEIKFVNIDGEEYEPGYELEMVRVPSDFNEVALTTLQSYDDMLDWNSEERFVYAQIMQIRFKRMLSGRTTTTKLNSILKTLAGINKDKLQYAYDFFNDQELVSAYNTYYNKWNQGNAESITISSNGNVVFSWVETLGTPQTCTISNWTGRLSVVNPQHLSAVGKKVINPNMLNDFGPFRLWYKLTYNRDCGGEVNAEEAKAWFNSLSVDQFNFWIDPYSGTDSSMLYDNIPGGATVTVDRAAVQTNSNENQQWSGIDKTYIVDCGGYNQVIWGCGISPDFMYPVVDLSRPTPNLKTECLVYCNDAGYNTIKLAFVNSPVEEYLVARFKSGVSGGREDEIVNEINSWAKKAMIFPDNIKSAYFANDTDNVLNCSGFRVAYIPNLVHTIDIVSIILCSAIGLLAFIICFVIIKRYVERNRINIGIMRANGISKAKIALSLFPFALFPALIGGIAAYFVGLFLQTPTLKLFSNYWTLPTKLIGFDWISMVVCVVAPFILFGLISFIATMIVLRTKSVDLMKAGSEFKTNQFSRIVKKPFKHFGIMTRFRVSLAFNSLSRLLMMAAMSCLTMSSLVFAFTTFDKLNKSRAINSSQFDYSFSLKLTTPTSSGSTYSTYDYSQLGSTDPKQYLYNINWNTANPDAPDYNPYAYEQLTRWYSHNSISSDQAKIIGKNGNLMLPSAADMTGQSIDLMYLADKVSSRLTLDYNLGASFIGATSNPWEIALALMPSNSRNLAADGFNKIIQHIGEQTYKATELWEKKYDELGGEKSTEGHRIDETIANKAAEEVKKDNVEGKWLFIEREHFGLIITGHYNYYNATSRFFDKKINADKSITYTLNKHDWLTGFSDAFTHLIVTAYTDKEIVRKDYPIQYRSIPINWDYDDENVKKDELYTYIEAHIGSLSNNEKVDSSHTITIEGIQPDSNFIYLTNNKGEEINSLLFSEDYLNDMGVNESIHPIIVNAYAAHKYNLHVGSTLNITATNTVDRYEQTIHPERFDENANKAIFKVVGISSGTNGEAFYTTQIIANDVLGLPDGHSWNKTHRYMRWQEKPSIGYEETPQLVDLAGIAPDSEDKKSPTIVPDPDHIVKYTFNTEDSPEIKKPIIDTTSIKRLNPYIPTGFNGIYTANKSGKPLTNCISLYSYTGMYPGTSVYKTNGSVNKFAEILAEGANLGIANLMTCIEDPEIYKACNEYNKPDSEMTKEEYTEKYIRPFIDKVAAIYGDTTMITAICGAMDVAASDLIYTNLIQTFDIAETSIMAIVIPITIIIVGIISNLIIIDSKKMAAMLKALGYSDGKNLMSILAMFIPTIVFGLALAVPLSYGLTIGYQSLIFNSANILVDVSQKWWYYVAAVGGIGIILVVAYAIGYASLKRSRLVDEIK